MNLAYEWLLKSADEYCFISVIGKSRFGKSLSQVLLPLLRPKRDFRRIAYFDECGIDFYWSGLNLFWYTYYFIRVWRLAFDSKVWIKRSLMYCKPFLGEEKVIFLVPKSTNDFSTLIELAKKINSGLILAVYRGIPINYVT